MQKIAIRNLPEYSPWPARIMGLKEWEVPTRNLDKIEEEYNQDKYARLKKYVDDNTNVSYDDLRKYQIGVTDGGETVVSMAGEIYKTTVEESYRLSNESFLDIMSNILEDDSTVIELGCGWGYNLALLAENFPEAKYIGGEYAMNAVEIAEDLFDDNRNIDVQQFNYHDDNWNIFENIDNAIVFTRHSIEQLPSANPAVEGLLKNRDLIDSVIHCEPIVELVETDLLGMLRERYAILNDYNRDLKQLVSESKEINNIRTEYDRFGLNPFNPTSVVHWEPVRK